MTSTLLPMAAFEMIKSPDCRVASRSFRDALASGLALGAAAVPDCAACIAKCAAPTPLSLSSLALSVPPLLRDASTTSTPSPSDCDSGCSSPRRSASLSPFELLHSDEDDSDSDSRSNVSPCAWSSATSFLRSVMPVSAVPLPPLDLCSHVRELDESEYADEIPDAEHDAFSDDEYELSATDSSADVSFDVRLVARTRHRTLLQDNEPNHIYDRYDWRRSRYNGYPLRFYTSSLRHLRRGATGIDHHRRSNNYGSDDTEAAQPPPPAPLTDPFMGEADQRKKVAAAKRKAGRAEAAAHPDNGRPRHRGNGKQSGAHQVQRKKVHKQRHSLAAPTRPAVKAARSQAHRVVLQQRAARKAQLITAAAHPQRAPKHSRSSSAPAGGKKAKAATTALSAGPSSPSSDLALRDDVSCRHASSFGEFRRLFYLRHRALLEGALGTGYARRVTGIRLAPIASAASGRFMTRLAQLRPAERDVALAFHGTPLQNMQSICERGLLVPDPHRNGIRVAHGSALGVGIYTAQDANYSAGYASSTSTTIFACAVLTTGAVPYSFSASAAATAAGRPQPECIGGSGVFVLTQEARVCPLFLIDFDNGGGYSGARRPPPPADEPPFLPLKLIRVLLRRAHTNAHRDGRRTAALLNSTTAVAD